MPTLVVQMGHCYRKSGATGTTGEQQYATRVAEACMRLLNGRAGWTVNTTLADENDYRGSAFVAIHCDGSTNPSARGASIGYRTPEGQAFGQAWKRAYAARGWTGGFRPDNYTAALSGYYGTRNAVSVGNRRAFIAECGFRTNASDRALLDASGGPERVALAIGDALGITNEEDDMTPEQDRILGELHEALISGHDWATQHSKSQVYKVLADVVTRAVSAADAAKATAAEAVGKVDALTVNMHATVSTSVAAAVEKYFVDNPPVVHASLSPEDRAAIASAVVAEFKKEGN